MASLKFVFVFGVLAGSLGNVRPLSMGDRSKIYEAILPFIRICSEEFGLSKADVRTAKEAGSTAKLDPCFIGCVFKKTKVINEKGLFDTDKASEIIKKYLSDESDQKKALDIMSSCNKVNERDVSDGEKGCERSGFLFECLLPHKESFIN